MNTFFKNNFHIGAAVLFLFGVFVLSDKLDFRFTISEAAPITYQASSDFVTYAGKQSSGLADPNRWQYLNFWTGGQLVYYSSHPDCGNVACRKSTDPNDKYHIIGT